MQGERQSGNGSSSAGSRRGTSAARGPVPLFGGSRPHPRVHRPRLAHDRHEPQPALRGGRAAERRRVLWPLRIHACLPHGLRATAAAVAFAGTRDFSGEHATPSAAYPPLQSSKRVNEMRTCWFAALLCSGLLLAGCRQPSSAVKTMNVIIDHDGGIDDLIALTMLMRSEHVRVRAVTICPADSYLEPATRRSCSSISWVGATLRLRRVTPRARILSQTTGERTPTGC